MTGIKENASVRKKTIRRMARKMLWSDVKSCLRGFKLLLLIVVAVVSLFLPYIEGNDLYNGGMSMYINLILIMLLLATPEQIFNYLPMTQKEIRYYLNYRTNLLTAFVVMLSVMSGAVMELAGAEPFWDRGLANMLAFLTVLEAASIERIYEYCKREGETLSTCRLTGAQKKRAWIYLFFIIVSVLGEVVIVTLMRDNQGHLALISILVMYQIVAAIRRDMTGWTRFDEYTKYVRRSPFESSRQAHQRMDEAKGR